MDGHDLRQRTRGLEESKDQCSFFNWGAGKVTAHEFILVILQRLLVKHLRSEQTRKKKGLLATRPGNVGKFIFMYKL